MRKHRKSDRPPPPAARPPHRDARPVPTDRGGSSPRERLSGTQYWIYGRHPVMAALANPHRHILRLCATRESASRIAQDLRDTGVAAGTVANLEIVPREEIARRVPSGAVHQGVLAAVAPLPEVFLADLIAEAGEQATLVVLDQVTDPHNAGAILRSAEAFGAKGIVTTDRHTPEETGTLAKAASGALERVPLVRVTNLARTLRELKESGFWILGLSERGTVALKDARPGSRIAIVLGAEGEGLRRLTEETCDLLVRLPMQGAMPSLNVSNAAAIVLYELARSR
jgi:23S rRNA (guanosine2251-2'-O)-methyltransferase